MGDNTKTSIISIILAGLSIAANMIIKYLLINKEYSFSKLLSEILTIESFYYFSRLLFPLSFEGEGNGAIPIGFSIQFLKKIFGMKDYYSDKVKRFNYLFTLGFEGIIVLMNIFLSFEIRMIFKGPLSQIRKRRIILYNIVCVIVFLIFFFSGVIFRGQGDEAILLVYNLILAFVFIAYSIISCVDLLVNIFGKKSIMTKLFLIKHILFFLIFTGLFFPVKINAAFNKWVNKEKPNINLQTIFLMLNLSTGLGLFPIRLLETKVIWILLAKIKNKRKKVKELKEEDRKSTASERNKKEYSFQFASKIQNKINLELMNCILYGLTEIFSSSSSQVSSETPDQDDVSFFHNAVSTSEEDLEKLGVTHKDFKRIKTHIIKYFPDDVADSFKIKVMSTVNEKVTNLSRIGVNFKEESQSKSSTFDSLRRDEIPQEHDAELIEYFPKVFEIIRKTDDISAKSLEMSLSPRNNKNLASSLVESKGKSESFFFFSDDKQFIIKTIRNSELEHLITKLLPNYFSYIVSNQETLLTKIYGIYTVTVNNNLAKVNIILMQNLIYCPIDQLIYTFDLKGSSFQRKTKINKLIHPTKALKDLDFLWKKRVEKDLIDFSKDAKDSIMTVLEKDANFLCKNNLIDYSLFFVIMRYNEDKPDILLHLQSNQLYSMKTFKSENKEYIYVIGIIDYLQDFNTFKFLEREWKGIIYWKEEKNFSVQDPVTYKERFLEFVKTSIFDNP